MNQALKDWTINYVKHKDMAFRKLLNVEEKKECIMFKFKDKAVAHFVIDQLDTAIFALIKDHEHATIVCPNIEDNLEFLLKEW